MEIPAGAAGGTPAIVETADPRRVLAFLRVVGVLKRAPRTGWLNCGVKNVESIADHMYRMALACFLLQDEDDAEIDVIRAMKMALVHDIAEALVGDITPHQGVAEADKHILELRAARRLQSVLGASSKAGTEVLELWKEYDAGESPVARFVKDIDKFEMTLQAQEYEGATGIDLSDFFDSVRLRIKTPTITRWFDTLEKQRLGFLHHTLGPKAIVVLNLQRALTSVAAGGIAPPPEDTLDEGEREARGHPHLRFVDSHNMNLELPPSHVTERAVRMLTGERDSVPERHREQQHPAATWSQLFFVAGRMIIGTTVCMMLLKYTTGVKRVSITIVR